MTILTNALAHYHGELQEALAAISADKAAVAGRFAPDWRMPDLTDRLRAYLAASDLGLQPLPAYRGRRLTLLDLRRNPATRTTKTMASLVMVARAVRYIERTGERVHLLTPSSGNKATALRDAVYRAVDAGLVTGDQLGITTVIPAVAADKTWRSPLDLDRNPVAVYAGPAADAVKAVADEVAARDGRLLKDEHGVNLWYSLDIDNYRVADAVRAFAEQDLLPPAAGRLHVHAVSSAYGLLGHDFGVRRRTATTGAPVPPGRYLLVQHLHTPDMVLSLLTGSPERTGLPAYAHDAVAGLYRQDADPHFPYATFDPHENLETTFYTRRPPTSAEINPMIQRRGGGGIVVSLYECLARYGEVRALLADTDVALPTDPRRLREWSLVMAVTGLLTAIDRGLVPAGEDDIVIHASGSYGTDDFTALPEADLRTVADGDDLRKVVVEAVTA
jgi:hypothetical protein